MLTETNRKKKKRRESKQNKSHLDEFYMYIGYEWHNVCVCFLVLYIFLFVSVCFFLVFFKFINETLNTSDCKPTLTENRLVKKSILPGNTHNYTAVVCVCVCVSLCMSTHTRMCVCMYVCKCVCV